MRGVMFASALPPLPTPPAALGGCGEQWVCRSPSDSTKHSRMAVHNRVEALQGVISPTAAAVMTVAVCSLLDDLTPHREPPSSDRDLRGGCDGSLKVFHGFTPAFIFITA